MGDLAARSQVAFCQTAPYTFTVATARLTLGYPQEVGGLLIAKAIFFEEEGERPEQKSRQARQEQRQGGSEQESGQEGSRQAGQEQGTEQKGPQQESRQK